MIKKIFLQSIVSAMLFLIVLFSFSRVDWLSVFDLRETVIEEKLGDMYWDLYSGSAVFLESDTVLAPLDSLLSHLCEANDIERDKIKLHVVQSNEVNAFAMPVIHLVLFPPLIPKAKKKKEFFLKDVNYWGKFYGQGYFLSIRIENYVNCVKFWG